MSFINGRAAYDSANSDGSLGLSLISLAVASLIAFGLFMYVGEIAPPTSQSKTQASFTGQGSWNSACKVDDDTEKSELCAQWKAADAAHQAAKWSFYGLLLAGVGSVGLFLQLYYTRRALENAQQSNAKIVKASHDQLRPYLGFDGDSSSLSIDKSDKPPILNIHIAIKNFGQTPARNVESYDNLRKSYTNLPKSHEALFSPKGSKFPLAHPPKALEKTFDIAPQDSLLFVRQIKAERILEVLSDKSVLRISIQVAYRDTDGNPHSLKFYLQADKLAVEVGKLRKMDELFFSD